jgi:hypothetical protein
MSRYSSGSKRKKELWCDKILVQALRVMSLDLDVDEVDGHVQRLHAFVWNGLVFSAATE